MAMIERFIRDDSGSVSAFNLLIFVLFSTILGIAMDFSGAVHGDTRVQTAADAAAHAGVMDLYPLPPKAIVTAVAYGEANVKQNDVVVAGDVRMGRWNPTTRLIEVNSKKYA